MSKQYSPKHPFIPIEIAIQHIKEGRFVIMLDDENRENEGDLIIAADKITPDAINFMTKYGRGLVCLPMSSHLIDRLYLPMMVKNNTSKYGTAFTISIGAKHGITTGISAYDRAKTVQVAIDPNTTPEDLSYPGHIFPLRANENGVLKRAGHTEAAVDLARLAGLTPASVLCEVLNENGTMARRDDLIHIAAQHNISLVSIADLIQYRMTHEVIVKESATAILPMKPHKDARIKIFQNMLDDSENVVLIFEPPNQQTSAAPLVRIHSQCLTGDIFGSIRCDCGEQLSATLEKMNQEGGILLYLTNQEGRGIGLTNKIKAYALQEEGMDTVEANEFLGFSADQRDYGLAAQILKFLGLQKIRLLTNNPRKITGVEKYGITVLARESIEVQPIPNNTKYLNTKRDKLGHLLSMPK